MVSGSAAASGDRGNDRDLVTVVHGGVELLEESDVLAVHIEIDEATDLALLVAESLANAGLAALEIIDDGSDARAIPVDGFGSGGELAERCGYFDGNGHC